MYIRHLVSFANREKLAESTAKGYEERKLDWIIKLGRDGEFKGFVPMEKGTKHIVPYLGRSSQTRPILLYDKPEYVLGWKSDNKNLPRAAKRHASFCQLVAECAEKTGEPAVRAVYQFLQQEDLHKWIPDDLSDDHWITFQIEETDEKPVDLASVKEFWANKMSQADEGQARYQCFVCGQSCVPLRVHNKDFTLPIKMNRERGKLISANGAAYVSYGLKQSLIAPTCEQCEEKYGRSLEKLLKSRDHQLVIENVVYLFWTKKQEPPVFKKIIAPTLEDVQELKKKVFAEGHENVESFREADFYCLALSQNKSRLVVRDWEETTLANVKRNIYHFLQRQRIGKEERYYGIFQLIDSLFREKKEITPNIQRSLLKHAIFGKRLPEYLLYQAVHRCRKERKVSRARVAVIRLCLTQDQLQEDYLMELDEKLNDQGYLCGRLFAVIEKIQLDAYRKPGSKEKRVVNSTITDRYYGTASSSPAAVFGTLLRNAKTHLSKLEKDPEKVGWAIRHQKQLEEIASKLQSFPSSLTLIEQSMFALGYLHQQDKMYEPNVKS